jgi:hypothetical protein
MDVNARLSIDFWHTTVRSSLRRSDGAVITLMVDGDPSASTGVALGDDNAQLRTGRDADLIAETDPLRYVRLPGQRLLDDQIQLGPAVVDPVDVVAAALAPMVREAAAANAGRMPTEVVVTTPAGWVGRQQQGLRAAARRAGLDQVRLLDGVDAILRHQIACGAEIPLNAVVVVCRLDVTVGEVAVLARRPDGFEHLAIHDLGEVGETPGATLPAQAVVATRRALAAAGVDGACVTAVFCQSSEAAVSALRRALPATAGVAVPVQRVGDLTASLGGLQATVPAGPVKRRWRFARVLHSLAGIVVGGFGAAMLVYQELTTGQLYGPSSISATILVTQWGAWGLASVFALLALVSAAVAVADLRNLWRRTPADPESPDQKLGSWVAFAAALGVGGAAALALVAATTFGIGASTLLAWTLGSTIPVALAAGGLGLLAARVRAVGGWPDRLRFPVEALAVAAVSTVAIVASFTGVPFTHSTSWWTLEHLGAIGMGYAVAWLVTRRPGRLMIVGPALGLPATFAISLRTFDEMSAFLIAAVALWWLARLVGSLAPQLSGVSNVQVTVGRAPGVDDSPPAAGHVGAAQPE